LGYLLCGSANDRPPPLPDRMRISVTAPPPADSAGDRLTSAHIGVQSAHIGIAIGFGGKASATPGMAMRWRWLACVGRPQLK
jgi:hypothetical protein